MVKRERLDDDTPAPTGGAYFTKPNTTVEFFSSGCKLLDLALGGGWAERRVSNIVGDKATGKTLLAIEASANFIMKYPRGIIRYREAESAFDEPYAESLGLPISRVDFGEPMETVEDLFDDFKACLKKGTPQLYIVDSLDALSDDAEMKRGLDEGSYGTAKAKMLSQFFRRNVRAMEENNITLMIISQIRDNITTMPFAKKTKRSGGHALDFYASQVVDLAQLGLLKKTVSGIERAYGAKVQARISKNKIALPYREAEFQVLFGYGIDDERACVEFLKKAGGSKLLEKRPPLDDLRAEVERRWFEIEDGFVRKDRKYG